jgi:hypothetical protein
LIPILNPGRHGRPGHPSHWVWNHHDHGHWAFRDGVWIDIDAAVDETPAVVSQPAPGPCTCLTKNYTPNGLVVFSDICTKEAASAQVGDSAADATQGSTSGTTQAPTSSATQVPTADVTQVPTSPNYAGRTYADYLAANPQVAPQAPQKN